MMHNKHTHQYKRIDLSQKEDKHYFVYKCQKPDCSHYLIPALVLGKLCECPRCGEDFIIEREHLDLVSPRCNNCKREVA